MKILLLDTCSNLLDFGMRCQMYGHEVKWWDKTRKDGSLRRAGEGILDKIEDYESLRKRWIGWADLVVLADNTFYLDLLEPYRRIGYPIMGCSVAAAELELDRDAGQRAMKESGLQVIESKSFHDYDAAIAYVKKNAGKVFVSKPSGEADKALSYVATNAADLVYMMERWKKVPKYVESAKSEGFILQERKHGCEMAVGGWFGPGGWAGCWYENFEFKKLMNDDLGVNTGEMGTCSMYVRQSKLADKILKPLTPILEKLGYVGFIDNNAIIDDKGIPWPMELTMRPGWPTFHNQIATHKNADPAQWMLDLLEGRDTLECVEDTVCVSVVLAQPDFPYSHLSAKEVTGIPMYFAPDPEHIHLSEVMLGEAPCQIGDKVADMPCFLTAGDYLAVITGTGPTITSARKAAYSAVKKIKVPNSVFYRTDIGRSKLVTNLPAIQKHGYALKFWY